MIIISEVQFKNLKTKDLVNLKCDYCGISYQKTKGNCVCNMIRNGIRCFDKKTYCSKECNSKAQISSKPINKCQCCGKDTTNPRVCSRSCGAKISNKNRPKRKCKIGTCNRCGSATDFYRAKFCASCKKEGWHLLRVGMKLIGDRSLSEVIKEQTKSAANRYNPVRGHANRLYRNSNNKCSVCGYSKHVEICHKKAIKDFSLDALVKDINAPENIVLLCPNHHWEFDKGLLKLDN